MVNLHNRRRTGWCALVCAVCIIVSLFGGVTQVHAAGSGSIYGSGETAEAGDTVTVFFALSNNPGIWGLNGQVTYDTSVMTLTSVSAGEVFSSSEIMMPESLGNPFSFLATASSIADKTGTGALIYLTFEVKSNAAVGDYSIGLNVTQAINVNEEDISVSVSSASIEVVSCLHR